MSGPSSVPLLMRQGDVLLVPIAEIPTWARSIPS